MWASRLPSLVQKPSDGAADENEEKVKGVEAAGAARVRQELDDPPKHEKRGGDHQSDADLADSRRRGPSVGGYHAPRPQTPRASGAQICLCIWSCIRTGSRSPRIHPANRAGSNWPNAQLISTALTRAARLWRGVTSRAHS